MTPRLKELNFKNSHIINLLNTFKVSHNTHNCKYFNEYRIHKIYILSLKLHLMDHIRGKMRSSDTDVVAVQYQFVVVANAIWSFGIDSVKPLNLFNRQESNLFFQGSPSSSTFVSSSPFQSLNLFQSDHSRGVKHCRRRFLEAACDGAVACIHQLSNGELDW